MKHFFCAAMVLLVFVGYAQAAEVPFVELKGHTDKNTSVIFLADGKKMLTFGTPGTPDTIWDVETWKKVAELPEMFLSHSPDGKKIAAGPLSEWYESGSVEFDIIVDTETGKQLYALPGSFHKFSSDGTKVVVWTRNKTRTICDAETGKRLYVLTDVLPEMSLRFSQDGKKIAVVNENSTRILDTESGKELRVLPEKFLGFTPDGKRIITASRDNTARIWTLE
ncbi:MAG: hypothetical protein FWE95_02190 [Planctomycetaceae bacterium]|nr:hypothetical protein [Planctomycetaceae bacterium]